MNKTLTITAIVMFAVIIGVGVMIPAMAVSSGKSLVCLYDIKENKYKTNSIPTNQVAKYLINNPGSYAGACV